jgi:RHS repeat-associated protein
LAAEYSNQAPASTGASWMFTDMLGSVRAITSESQNVVECYDYLPFGRMLSSADNGRSAVGCHPANPDAQLTSATSQKFTGKERDAETGLDYFLARYYSGAQGRFLSPDEFKGGPDDALTGQEIAPPGPLPYADITNPQSLNKYAYVLNNPLRFIDADGHSPIEEEIRKRKAHRKAIYPFRPEGTTEHGRIIYNETSGLRTTDKKGGTAADLHNARVAIGHVLNQTKEKTASDALTKRGSQDVATDKSARGVLNECDRAAKEADKNPDNTQGATHFVLNFGQKMPDWVPNTKVIESFGPFPNPQGGGDVTQGVETYIEIRK